MTIRNKASNDKILSKCQKIFEKAITDCHEWRIPISNKIETPILLIDRKTCYAITYKDPETGHFKICMSMLTLREYPNKKHEEAIYNYIMHELCHTIDGCFNHRNEWKRWIIELNEKHGTDLNPRPYSTKRSNKY